MKDFLATCKNPDCHQQLHLTRAAWLFPGDKPTRPVLVFVCGACDRITEIVIEVEPLTDLLLDAGVRLAVDPRIDDTTPHPSKGNLG